MQPTPRCLVLFGVVVALSVPWVLAFGAWWETGVALPLTALLALGIDAALAPGAATHELVGMIERAGPFGAGNALPRFAVTSVRVSYAQQVGEGHVRCTLVGAERGRIEAIAFRAGQTALGPALLDPARPVLHVAGALRIDRYGGRDSVRLQIDDAAPASGSVLA